MRQNKLSLALSSYQTGLAMVDGRPKYVTAVCRCDRVDGWRDRRKGGGVVIDFLPNVKNPMMIGLRTPEIRHLITFEPGASAGAGAA